MPPPYPIDGSDADNRILATPGPDLIRGLGGHDRVSAQAGDDSLQGGDGNDTLFGDAGNDTLMGFAGDDRLDGGSGADLMAGDSGSDIYVIDHPGDTVQDGWDPGRDLVIGAISVDLKAAIGLVEDLTLTGTGNLSGTGNTLANLITGNAGNNLLDGAAGNDTQSGGAGHDTLIGGEGNDNLSGGAGDDWFLGGAGTDTLSGGDGNDSYDRPDAGDVIVETMTGGFDRIRTDRSLSLQTGFANIEAVELTGVANLSAVGSAVANRLTGNAGQNSLAGLGGNDTLQGLAGNDTLLGDFGTDQLLGGTGDDRLDGGGDAGSMQSRQTTDVVLQALLMAVWRRKPKNKVLVHSDQGSQFTSMDYHFNHDRALSQRQHFKETLRHAHLHKMPGSTQKWQEGTYGVKWDKAVAKLAKDRDALLTFYDYPAEHWKHIRTSDPIESTFATVRHRTKRTKGCLSCKTGLAMAFKLMMSAQKKWRKLDGQNRLPEIIRGVEFRDELRKVQAAA